MKGSKTVERKVIEERVLKIVSNILQVEISKLRPNLNFKEDLQADSLAITEIGQEIEADFKLTFEPQDLEKLKTIGDAIDHIEKSLKRK